MRVLLAVLLLGIVGCGGEDKAATSSGSAPNVPGGMEVTNSIGMKLRLIPAGEFMMGSPETESDRLDTETQHRVSITKPFYLGVTEVTQEQYEKVMEYSESTGVKVADLVRQGLDYVCNQNEPKSESNDRRQGDGQKEVPIFRVHIRGCHGATNGQQGQCSQDHARQENLCKEKHQPDDQQCYGESHFRENKPEGAELQ